MLGGPDGDLPVSESLVRSIGMIKEKVDGQKTIEVKLTEVPGGEYEDVYVRWLMDMDRREFAHLGVMNATLDPRVRETSWGRLYIGKDSKSDSVGAIFIHNDGDVLGYAYAFDNGSSVGEISFKVFPEGRGKTSGTGVLGDFISTVVAVEPKFERLAVDPDQLYNPGKNDGLGTGAPFAYRNVGFKPVGEDVAMNNIKADLRATGRSAKDLTGSELESLAVPMVMDVRNGVVNGSKVVLREH